jgi:hypothetical protein
MKKLIFILGFLFLPFCVAQAETNNWRTEKSTHFIVYYKNASEDFAKQVADKAEGFYNRIADDLGFRRYDFWLWDKRAKIYIHNDAGDFQNATGQPAWSAGAAIPTSKIIHTYPYAERFFDTILPHEMGHIIFREFVGFYNPAVPLWLDEGVASYQEDFRGAWARDLLRHAITVNSLMDLNELANVNPHLMQDTHDVNLFYAESVSIIEYLIKEFGKDSFVSFCQVLRDKKNLERAIASTYPIQNLNELNQKWQKYLSGN